MGENPPFEPPSKGKNKPPHQDKRMKKLSVHINRKLTPNLRHNDRSTKETHQNVFAEKSSLNQCDKSAKEAMREINQLYKEAMEKMKGKKGKRTPKENSYLEMIFEVDENHTLEDCQKLADEICEITNFRRIQITLHKDEGHYEKDGSFKTHYHAHAVFFTLDKEDGKQLARREKSLSDTNLANFHKLAYKVLRGEEKIKGEKKEYINDYREYKKIKAKEQELEEKELEQLERVNKFFDYKEQEEPRLEALAKKLAQKEQELAQKELKIQEEIKSIEKQKEWILSQKEELIKERTNLQKEKAKILSNAETAYEALRSEYENRFSLFKNIVTFGGHRKRLDREFETAENFLANQTQKAVQEVNTRLSQTNQVINDYKEQIAQILQEKREAENKLGKKQEELNNANQTIQNLRETIQNLRDKYEPKLEQEKKIQNTQTKTQDKSKSYGFSR